MDGVRLNQPFGDVVSWDLIPRIALSSVTLMPGSNPLYGLNTLGGALAIQTKNGRANKGGSMQALWGSHDRAAVELEYGGASVGGWNWYVAGNRLGEHGWRDDSSSDIRQAFGKLGWQGMKSDLNLTYAYAGNSLTGMALQDIQFCPATIRAFIRSRTIQKQASFANLTAKHSFNESTARGQHLLRAHPHGNERDSGDSPTSRSTSLTAPNKSPSPTPGIPDFPPVARTHPMRRFHSGDALPTCCVRMSREKNAMA
jgi:hypothetical protein